MLSPSEVTVWPATSPNPTLTLIVTLSEKAAWKNWATAFTVETNPVGALFTLESKLRLTFIGGVPASSQSPTRIPFRSRAKEGAIRRISPQHQWWRLRVG